MVFTETFVRLVILASLIGVAGGGVYLLALLWKDLTKRKVW